MPACRLEDLGDASFRLDHGLRYASCRGRWPTGSARSRSSRRWGGGDFLGIFGAAGLSLNAVEQAIDKIQHGMGDSIPYGMNLIHSPGEPELEAAVVDLYLRRRVRLVEASAFLNLTLPVVRYRVAGLARDESGRVVATNRIIAKVSRVEVASKFMAPPPAPILRELVATGAVTAGASGVGGAISDGRRYHGRGRFRRTHRQPAGHRAAADDVEPARHAWSNGTTMIGRSASGRPAESRLRGRRPRRWRWVRPTW